MVPVRDTTAALQILSELSLAYSARHLISEASVVPGFRCSDNTMDLLSRLSPQDLQDLRSLAMTNHVVIRSFTPLLDILLRIGQSEAAEWVAAAIQSEQARIQHAIGFLSQICSTLETAGCPVVVIKSLDHWPDLGSDLDLYSDAHAAKLNEVMRLNFGATLAERSWGDRLANKWNFVVPGLPELVEVHAGRLGQTGEQTAVTQSLTQRTESRHLAGGTFRVGAPEDRVVISTLQRMYRHFYIRLCDIVDNWRLLDAGLIDFSYLYTLGTAAGLWDGIATYLNIISEYAAAFGHKTNIPAAVSESAKFGTGRVRFRRQFLRVPILPDSLALYSTELKSLLLKGELRNSLRLTLLPGLAAAAAIEQKITGSDKGVW